MTLTEKASLLSGANFWNTTSIERLGIPSMMLTDGPHGLRKQAGKADHLGLSSSVPATCFPTAAALAASWDESLLKAVGQAIGAEAAAHKVSVLLGPGLNIVRDPLAGRAFEYFSEDPYNSGKLAAAMVRGIQANGIAATPKHFAVNSQEHMRMSIDEVVDERTMRELYLEGFRRVIQEAQPRMLMTAYNKVNGTYANEHPQLLDTILRGEWKYKGALVTDWGGNHDPVAGVAVGGALEMPSSNGLTAAALVAAVQKGDLSEQVLDERVGSLLDVVFSTTEALKNAPDVQYDTHHRLAREAAERSIVLLQNTNATLPFKQGETVAVIGDFAKNPRYQGAGSSLVNPTRVTNALQSLLQTDNVTVVGYEPGFTRTGQKSTRRRRRAVALAQKASTVVVFLGLDEAKEAEGIDRQTMALPAVQLELIDAIAAVHKKVVVVLAAGGALEVPFADKVQAIIHSSLSGQAGGEAVANVLTGVHNPSGKLAVSWPYRYGDAPTARYFPGHEATAEHREGLFVGYRYYETANVAVRYPFGHGLSYTTFDYSNVSASEHGVKVTITNTGKVDGEEIVQVYVQPKQASVFRPVRELKGFVKVALKPGEQKTVSVEFDDHAFAYYSIAQQAWVVDGGVYEVEVGASVRDIRQTVSVTVKGTATMQQKEGYLQQSPLLTPYHTGDVTKVSDEAFAALLGYPIPQATWNNAAPYRYDDTIRQLRCGPWWGRLFVGTLTLAQKFLFAIHKPYVANNVAFIMNLPFSKLPGFTGGKISEARIKRALRIKE